MKSVILLCQGAAWCLQCWQKRSPKSKDIGANLICPCFTLNYLSNKIAGAFCVMLITVEEGESWGGLCSFPDPKGWMDEAWERLASSVLISSSIFWPCYSLFKGGDIICFCLYRDQSKHLIKIWLISFCLLWIVAESVCGYSCPTWVGGWDLP